MLTPFGPDLWIADGPVIHFVQFIQPIDRTTTQGSGHAGRIVDVKDRITLRSKRNA